MTGPTAVATDLDRVVDALRSGERFLLTAHEGPDGDALGSLLAMHHVLRQLGKDSVMFLHAKEFPLPVEYRFLPLEEVFHEPPADVVDRTLVFLDCGNIDRMPVEFLRRDGARVVNIDHHHDNTRFGSVNLVDTEASCTAEIVLDVAKRLGADITPEIASALYVGLVTDTGKFMYENTGPAAHRMAAELIEAGVDVDDTYRRLYERVPIEKLRLIARALEKIERHDEGRFAVTYISADDYEATGAGEVLTEGIIDFVRALEGTAVAAVGLVADDGGGGHRRAAGFGSNLSYAELVDFLRAEVSAQIR